MIPSLAQLHLYDIGMHKRKLREGTIAQASTATPYGFILFGPTDLSKRVAALPTSVNTSRYPTSDNNIWSTPWTSMHLEELITNPSFRGHKVMVYMLNRWIKRVLTRAVPYETIALADISVQGIEAAQNLMKPADLEKWPLMMASKTKGRYHVLPHITLCVDAWNFAAIALYRKLGFVEFNPDGEFWPSAANERKSRQVGDDNVACFDRIMMIAPAHALQSKSTIILEQAFPNSDVKRVGRPLILQDVDRNLHLLKPYAELAKMEATKNPKDRGIWYFDSGEARSTILYIFIEWLRQEYENDHEWPDDAHKLPDRWNDKMVQFIKREYPNSLSGLRTYLEGNADARLQPQPLTNGETKPSDDHIRSLLLDRMFSRPLRVTLSEKEWLEHVTLARASNRARAAQPWDKPKGMTSEERELMENKYIYVLTNKPLQE